MHYAIVGETRCGQDGLEKKRRRESRATCRSHSRQEGFCRRRVERKRRIQRGEEAVEADSVQEMGRDWRESQMQKRIPRFLEKTGGKLVDFQQVAIRVTVRAWPRPTMPPNIRYQQSDRIGGDETLVERQPLEVPPRSSVASPYWCTPNSRSLLDGAGESASSSRGISATRSAMPLAQRPVGASPAIVKSPRAERRARVRSRESGQCEWRETGS
jgi:hypothetical protein